MTTKQAIYI